MQLNGSGYLLSVPAATPPLAISEGGGGRGRLNLPIVSNTPPKGRRIVI